MNPEPTINDFLKLLLSPNNPVFFSILFFILIVLLIYFFFKRTIVPIKKEHKEETDKLELEQKQLMVEFAEMDPDPVIRINFEGDIIHHNKKADQLTKEELIGKNIVYFIPTFSLDLERLITNNESQSFINRVHNNHYSITCTGNKNMSMAQLYFHDITDRVLYEEKIYRAEQKQRELSNNLIVQLEEERKRIAGELHDSIGQNILSLKLKLNKISASVDDSILQVKHDIQAITEKTIGDLKEVIFNLRPKILEEAGLTPAITFLMQQVLASSQIDGIEDVELSGRRFSSSFEITIYRIVQETLNNIVKHSGAKRFELNIKELDEKIYIIIKDNGIGFNPEAIMSGFGLFSMKTRVEQLNGSMEIESAQNQGTTLHYIIPIQYAQ